MIQQAHLPPMRKVLVVDDTYAAGFMLGKLLEVIGHQVRVAQDGVEALEGFADAFTSARARRGPFLIEFSI